MASHTLVAKFAIVNILVAGQTFAADRLVSDNLNRHLVFYDGLAGDRFVAFSTLQIEVLELKFVFALFVVIKRDRLPLILIVALQTIFLQLTFVDIAMTV